MTVLSLRWFFFISLPQCRCSKARSFFSSILCIPSMTPLVISPSLRDSNITFMLICPDSSPSLDLSSELLASTSYCLLQVRCQVDTRSVYTFNVSNLTCLTQTPDLPTHLFLPESYPSQFKPTVLQLPRPKGLWLLSSPLFLSYSTSNPHSNWLLPSKRIQLMIISHPLHHYHPRFYSNSRLTGILASILDVTPTSTHSPFSIREVLLTTKVRLYHSFT